MARSRVTATKERESQVLSYRDGMPFGDESKTVFLNAMTVVDYSIPELEKGAI